MAGHQAVYSCERMVSIMTEVDQDNNYLHKKLAGLQSRLIQVAGSWTGEDYRTFVSFYSRILPELMHAERCTIFVMEQGRDKVCSIFGTGLDSETIEAPIEGTFVGEVIKSGQGRISKDLDERTDFHTELARKTGFICRTMICAPIRSQKSKSILGAIQLLNKEDDGEFDETDLARLEETAQYLALSIELVLLNREIFAIAAQFGEETQKMNHTFINGTSFIAESSAMREVFDLVRTVSKAPVNVLIQGENGTGKELIARMIHAMGRRAEKPFLAVNCACIPTALAESEFFGHVRGAFTGADQNRKGLFEEANGGTLFLDEIGEMPLTLQPKFLRAIQEGEGSRLGCNRIVRYDLRIISASNRDLREEVKQGRFREDLYFRIFSIEIMLPPLRNRVEDILPLARYFLGTTNTRFEKQVAGFTPQLIELFEQYHWPGNVRQLQKEIERLVTLTENGRMTEVGRCSRDLLSFAGGKEVPGVPSDPHDLALPARTKKLEINLIRTALARSQGNRTKAAALLDITRQGLAKKVKRYGL